MIHVTPQEVKPALRALFDTSRPTIGRAFAVLDGCIAGQILTDDPVRPTWGAVRERTFGTLYLGGTLDTSLVHRLVDNLRQTGAVVIGSWPDDYLLSLLPERPDYDGWALYFTNCTHNTGLDAYLQQIPPGCELRWRDRELFEHSHDRDMTLAAFGSVEHALARSLGIFLTHGNEILCEAATGPVSLGRVEIGVTTHAPYRGRGYATLTCGQLIRTCEEQGYDTWWDCAKQNLASAAVARKVGYRTERAYRVLVWPKHS